MDKEEHTLVKSRPEDWGKRTNHPLYDTWRWMRKMQVKNDLDVSWQDFWKFTKDVGDRPSQNHRLYRIDETLGYGPDNFKWKEVIEATDRADYARKWRKANPDKAKNADLKKMFGISLQDYSRMLTEQNGVCAICKIDACPSGLSFAVDHCHTTKKIRGLLCANCNKLLGHAKDNPDILTSAINYLATA